MEFIDPGTIDVFLKLFVAMLLGLILGTERAFAHKTAGMRTYALVSMGSALFVIISQIVTENFVGISNYDPLRVASQIVVGLGFLGAGIIIFREATLRGLTTAAGLWVASGIGIAVGYELYVLAVFTTLLTLFIFTILWFIEEFIESRLIFSKSHDTPIVKDEER